MAAVQLECGLKALLEWNNKETETMEIQNVPLPEDIVQGVREARGNFATYI
jgi:hypothetical protein